MDITCMRSLYYSSHISVKYAFDWLTCIIIHIHIYLYYNTCVIHMSIHYNKYVYSKLDEL